MVREDKYFETDFARIKPFLLARGREQLVKHMKPHVDNVVWCHTDGFITTNEFDVPNVDKIGALKFEGFCANVNIKNCIHKEGLFKI